eukprot:7503563-Pyramimonas_sp.AAC.1
MRIRVGRDGDGLVFGDKRARSRMLSARQGKVAMLFVYIVCVVNDVVYMGYACIVASLALSMHAPCTARPMYFTTSIIM